MSGDDVTGSPVVDIGNEMPFWSDGPRADSPLVAAVVRALVEGGRSVLVAGPHAADVLRAAASGGGAVTVLTRGRPDAESAGAALDGREVGLLSGDLARVDPSARFDVVVAAGGLEVLSSADAEVRRWRDLLGLLAALLAEGGTLLVGAADDVGLDSLSGSPRQSDDRDAAWSPGLGFDDSRPTGADELRAALEAAVGADAGSGAAWSLSPGLASPDLAVSPDVPVGGHTLLTARVCASLRRGHDDPHGLAVRVPVSGRFHALAPAALAVVGAVPALPPVVVPPEAPTVSGDDVDRPGSSVEQALLDASLAFDLPRVREVVERYATVLAGSATDTDLPAEVFLADDGGSTRLVRSGSDVPPDAALLVGLDTFARRLFALGWRHPWPEAFDDVDVTRVLLAGTGRETAREDVVAARAVGPDTADRTVAPGRLEREMEAIRSRELWYESTLRQRDAQLNAANARLTQQATPAQKQANRRRARPLPAPKGWRGRARGLAGRVRRRSSR